ncbi:CDP-diacylglycerol--inositol 3-phosphatidyltransferase 1-like [Ananas comosus]|uniref:CDP-diacylglycerol--inositol 3-phosphatidyltransferase n=1 Tax=Ananas comosus TaxID=4615 RepID=A0A6P5FGL4_ANACO|nr:CDP-diacylglycerol--inositol 3-phosphatidyltransferase 1-like [Ananas comosus]
MAPPSTEKQLSVYLYIPNIIGYLRIIINFVAFALCYSNKALFAILYIFSFFCDGLDGWFARKFNQVSTFGAVLDMVTDRVSTACLLAVLSQLYRPGLIFLALLGLDIVSHWFQMYSSFLSGKTSHKDVKDKSNWLLKAYYGHRQFMAFCCVASEVLYIILYFLADEQSTSVLDVSFNTLRRGSVLSLLFLLTLIGWALKQVINIIQMKSAADSCVFYDTKRSK